MADLHFIFVYLPLLLATPGLSSSQMVVTGSNITLVSGTSASIPCEYDKTVGLVSWQKGDLGSSAASEDLVILDKRSPSVKRTGDDDRFNITDAYSLKIHNISWQDEGRYFCTVYDFATEIPNIRQTDVMIEKRVVHETFLTLQIGRDAIIPCRFSETNATTIVRWMKDGLQIGDDNRYQSSPEDHSLSIRQVIVMDEGMYVCEYFNSNKKTRHQHVAHVTVIGLPVSLFPVIDVCDTNMERTTQNCTQVLSISVVITCSVNNYFPNISIIFLHKQDVMEVLTSKETANNDGTKNKEIFIRANPSNEPYVCMAQWIPGIDGERGAEVTITQSKPPNIPNTKVAVIILGVLCTTLAATVLGMLLYIRLQKGGWKTTGTRNGNQLQGPRAVLTASKRVVNTTLKEYTD
ncbi:tyrosine-protein phosphatase non-receptor type substrate 1-like [Diadema antillarum]|uniref:tyrosine-protein phosphatase non-receptor type substrate 1-like n=1 Tax=Diadema antillarum TaxID=105358 RepID=UPI003A839809